MISSYKLVAALNNFSTIFGQIIYNRFMVHSLTAVLKISKVKFSSYVQHRNVSFIDKQNKNIIPKLKLKSPFKL